MERSSSTAAPGLIRAALRYTRQDRLALVAAVLLTCLVAVVKVIYPLLIGAMMNMVQRQGVEDIDGLMQGFLLLMGALALMWTVRWPLKMLQFRVAKRAQNRMIGDLNQRLFSAPLSWHETRHSGDTAARVQQGSGALFDFTSSSYVLVEYGLQILGPIIVLAYLSPTVMALTLAGYAALTAISLWRDRVQRPMWAQESDANRRFGTLLVDGYRNVMTVYATRRRGLFASLLESRLGEVLAVSRRNVSMTEWKAAAIEVLSTVIGLGAVVLYVYLEVVNGRAANGVMLGNVYMVQAYAMAGVVAMLSVIGTATAVMRQGTEFSMSAPIYTLEPEGECSDRLPGGWHRAEIRGAVLVYPDQDGGTAALRSVDLDIERGRHYALVGANGSGKSSLLKLLSGLQRPDAGSLRVDGVPTDFGALRHAATLVPQHPELLEGTVGHNLLIGSGDDPAEVIARSRAVSGLLHRLGVTPDCHVHEAGSNWSGGQRQRIALARGILSAAGSSLVLVDEPTSSIDPEDERRIIADLRSEFADAAVIVSVHNLELVHQFDGIVVLENGAVRDAGPTGEVWARCDYFLLSDEDAGAPRIAAV